MTNRRAFNLEFQLAQMVIMALDARKPVNASMVNVIIDPVLALVNPAGWAVSVTRPALKVSTE